MLFSRSHEDGQHTGLDLYRGDVVRFPQRPGLKVPHIGWNTLRLTKPDCPLFAGLPPDPAVYFVHSYYPVPTDYGIVAAEADYPEPFCAAIWRDNAYATQFHPEKSQDVGLQMLRNFARL
jgi:glutamine amidotransferase